MKLIIPMAGRGSRLRPHTLTIPKPLLPVAGKPIVERIAEDLIEALDTPVDEIAFVIGDFGAEVERRLLEVAEHLGAKGRIYYQDQPLGTAHAILCARESLRGNCLVAFADTLFRADFSFNPEQDGAIWVKKVEDPSSFGVVKTDQQGIITEFVEKSPVFVSDLAIVGIYYFKDGENLRDELQYLLDHNIRDKGEYQLTSALENMKSKGLRFAAATIDEWLDCGNKSNVVDTNRRMLELKQSKETLLAADLVSENAVVIPPCFIGQGVRLKNAVVGPFVSIGNNCRVENSVIENSVIQDHTRIQHAVLHQSMIGSHAEVQGRAADVSLGDYTKYSA